MVKYLKKNSVCVISFFLTLLAILVFMAINEVFPFGDKHTIVRSDGYMLVYSYMVEFYDRIKGGKSLVFSWNNGFGMPFMPAYFTLISSPLNFFVLLVKRSQILGFISVTIAIRLAFAVSNMAYFLNNRDESKKNSIIIIPFSLAYGFGGYILACFFECMWLDSFALFPLIMLGYYRLTREKKSLLYIFSLALSAWCSFYITFIIALFLVLYFAFDSYDNFKDFIKKGLYFGVASIAAIGVSALSIIVSFISTKSSSVGTESFPDHTWFGNFFGVFRELFIFSKTNSLVPDLQAINLYCGTLPIVLIFVYGFVEDIKTSEKIRKIALLVILFVSTNEAVLNFIWHALHEPRGIYNRFGFVLSFLFIEMAYDAFSHITKNAKRLIPGMVMALAFPMVSYFFIDFDSQLPSVTVLLISMGLIFAYSVLLMMGMISDRMNKTGACIISAFMILEILVSGIFTLKNDMVNYEEYTGLTVLEYFESLNHDAENDDTELYRVGIIDSYNTRTKANYGSILGTNTISTFYNSSLDKNLSDFTTLFAIDSNVNYIMDHGLPEILEDVFAEKYIYATRLDDYSKRKNYVKKSENEGAILYENTDALSLGFGVNEHIIDSDIIGKAEKSEYLYETFNPVGNINSLVKNIAPDSGNILNEIYPEFDIECVGGDYTVYDTDNLNMIIIPDGSVEREVLLKFTAEQEGSYYLNVKYNDIGTIVSYINGKVSNFETFYDYATGMLYIGTVNIGDEVSIEIKNLYSEANVSDIYMSIGVSIYDQDVNTRFLDYVKDNQMTVSRRSDNYLEGTVVLEDDQILFTTIPYNDGWHVYENGKEIKKQKIANAFIGLDLGAGEHKLTFKYVQPGFYVGIIVSLLSVLLIIVYEIIRNKKIKAADNEGEINSVDGTNEL
jgi:uncharacterized membrane protein YfhO